MVNGEVVSGAAVLALVSCECDGLCSGLAPLGCLVDAAVSVWFFVAGPIKLEVAFGLAGFAPAVAYSDDAAATEATGSH